jgi:hypothetical protein
VATLTRDKRGRFTKALPGSENLARVINSEEMDELLRRGPTAYPSFLHPEPEKFQPKPGVIHFDVWKPFYQPIHNMFYAVWLIGTLLGMTGIALVVHYFKL